MTALVDLSDIVNRLTGGNSGTPQHIFSQLDGRIQAAAAAAPVANKWLSLWQYNQSNGANGAAPGAVEIPTRATIGSQPFVNPTGGRQQWLLGIEAALSQLCTLTMYDRLLHQGNLSGTVATAQTVGGTMTRYTGAESVGNQIWVEIYTALGSTATTITASYTNQAGTAGRTTRAVAIGGTGNNEAQRMIPLMLQDGDTGVQSVQTVTLAASTLTAGAFGVTIVRPLAQFHCTGAGYLTVRDLIAGLPAVAEMKTDACLTYQLLAGATTAVSGVIAVHVIEA
jgi:hypothetical protein